MPSAIVSMRRSGTGWPASSEPGYAAAPSACTPITRTSGLASLTASATPESKPPPPVHTRTVRTSGHCSRISSPTVPCPATMSGWSNGWMSTAPVSSAKALARASASSIVWPPSCTVAPYPRVAVTLGSAAPSGMNTVAEVSSIDAASATPWAWLPALAATTPRPRSSRLSREMRV